MFEGEAKNLSEVEKLFKKFLRDKQFISNLSATTLKSYEKDVFGRWKRLVGKEMPTAENLDDFVIEMRQGNLSVTTCNISIRSFNSFLSWLHSKGHIQTPLKIAKLKEEKKIMQTFSDEQLRSVLTWKPVNHYEWRFFAMFCVLMDTGVRVNECLTVQADGIDFDNLLMKVTGKGSKERIVPFSIELRKVLYTYASKHRNPHFKSAYFFCTRNGTKMSYHHFWKVFRKMCKDFDINHKDISGAFHAFRRKFGRNYLKQGGNLLYLQKIFGHEDLATTQRYIEVESKDLEVTHLRTSLVSRLKKK